jgi:hypothetical protein
MAEVEIPCSCSPKRPSMRYSGTSAISSTRASGEVKTASAERNGTAKRAMGSGARIARFLGSTSPKTTTSARAIKPSTQAGTPSVVSDPRAEYAKKSVLTATLAIRTVLKSFCGRASSA